MVSVSRMYNISLGLPLGLEAPIMMPNAVDCLSCNISVGRVGLCMSKPWPISHLLHVSANILHTSIKARHACHITMTRAQILHVHM